MQETECTGSGFKVSTTSEIELLLTESASLAQDILTSFQKIRS